MQTPGPKPTPTAGSSISVVRNLVVADVQLHWLAVDWGRGACSQRLAEFCRQPAANHPQSIGKGLPEVSFRRITSDPGACLASPGRVPYTPGEHG
jgi:hypothetical protein